MEAYGIDEGTGEQLPQRRVESTIEHEAGALRPRVSVVVPTKNEAANLPHVLPAVAAHADEVILVDADSSDGTQDVARMLVPDVKVVRQPGRGKGDALRAGFAAATGEIIVMLDADGSTDPNEIPAFVGALLAGADFAKGSRFMQGAATTDISPIRRLGNGFFVLATRLLYGGRYSDLCYGYNAFWRSAIDELELDGDGFEIETMMNVRALRRGLRVVEVASIERERIHGTSNLRALPDGLRVLRTLIAERFRPRGERTARPALPLGAVSG